MVEKTIEARGVSDKAVLDAMREVPRHRFIPASGQGRAYNDHPVPIGQGQTISQPYIVALMTELLEVEPGDKILEIGTGSGYQAAVLAEILQGTGGRVYTIEIFEKLGQRAAAVLEELGYKNVRVRIGDGFKGWPEEAPFDGIIVTASPSEVPTPLKEQLAEGARLVIPVGSRTNQMLKVYVKEGGKLVERDALAVRFVPLIDPDGQRY